MKRLFSFAAMAFTIFNGIHTAAAGELPTYEAMGFPITVHQFSVLQPPNVRQASPMPALMFGGMPASPHQIAVLTGHSKVIKEAAGDPRATAGLADRPD